MNHLFESWRQSVCVDQALVVRRGFPAPLVECWETGTLQTDAELIYHCTHLHPLSEKGVKQQLQLDRTSEMNKTSLSNVLHISGSAATVLQLWKLQTNTYNYIGVLGMNFIPQVWKTKTAFRTYVYSTCEVVLKVTIERLHTSGL